eukprot:scaffold731_cov261-Pinguiococcus_pyrenoidosus.AAC.111
MSTMPKVEQHVALGLAATHIAMAEASLFSFDFSLESCHMPAEDGAGAGARGPHAALGEDDDPSAAASPRAAASDEVRKVIEGLKGKTSGPATPEFLNKLADELLVDTTPQMRHRPTMVGTMLKETVEAGAVFGRPLEQKDGTPQLVVDCIAYLDAYGLYEKGLFRVPGNAERINDMKQTFDAGEQVVFEPPVEVNDVGAIFKLYFRLLPEPLIPSAHFHEFLDATKEQDKFASAVKSIVDASFPTINRGVLRLLLAFLSRVERLESVNMMTADNLGIVFAPNILRPGPNEEDKVEYLQPSILCCKYLIVHAPDIFPNLWEDYPQVPTDTPPSLHQAAGSFQSTDFFQTPLAEPASSFGGPTREESEIKFVGRPAGHRRSSLTKY